MLVGFYNSILKCHMIIFKLISLVKTDQHHHVLPEQERALPSHDIGGLYVVVTRRSQLSTNLRNTMASQEDLFTENLANDKPVDIDGDGRE